MDEYSWSLGAKTSGVYEMSVSSGRRRAKRTRKASEEAIFPQRSRDRGTATIYDMIRNDPVVAWGFGKYLDYGTVQYFASRTGDFKFDDELEEAFGNWSKARNCDVARRNSFDNMIRLYGAGITLDGDSMLLKITGGKLQGIESDRIRSTGDGKQIPDSVEGVIIDPSTNAATGYLLFNRGPGGRNYVFDRILNPDHLIFDGNFMRFDQVRGIPLIAPAVTTFEDAKETNEYQRIKAKNHALLAVAVMSQQGSGMNYNSFSLTDPPTTETADEDLAAPGLYSLEEATKLELAQNDKMDLIESHTPSTEYQTFNDTMIRQGLLTFGMAFSFYDSSKANYSSMKQDRAEFKFFIQRFMRKCLDARYEVTDWVLPQIVSDYGLKWSGSGKIRYEWLPQAEPWLDENNETAAAITRIERGLSSEEMEARRRGMDAYDILRQKKRSQEYIRRSGVVIVAAGSGSQLFNSNKLNAAQTESAAPPEASDTTNQDNAETGGNNVE